VHKYRVLFQKSAYKEYKKLPKEIRNRVDDALNTLSINPFLEILKFRKIRGKDNHYRIRIGDYRIIYSPQNDTLIIRIIRIGHRQDIYKYF
jgi:mRNA interferase RelE/StbE